MSTSKASLTSAEDEQSNGKSAQKPVSALKPGPLPSSLSGDNTPVLPSASEPSARNPSPSRPSARRPLVLASTAQPTNNARSPTRTAGPTPSAAAVQRAMSNPSSDLQNKLLITNSSADQPPHWPKSPRLQSSTASASASTRGSNSVEPGQDVNKQSLPDSQQPSTAPQAPSRLPRAASNLSSKLETVVESDQSGSPIDVPTVVTEEPDASKQSTTPKQPSTPTKLAPLSELQNELSARPPPNILRQEPARNVTAPAALPKKKSSQSNLVPAKPRVTPNDSSVQTMTVETETVASIPQTTNPPPTKQPADPSRTDNNGTVKLRPSNETIRPKKEKKRAKKAPSIISTGGPSTKADIFEAKVASEIEGDDSDSDETFVYESNPPERRPRQTKNHSRTPSATSMHSMSERRNGARTASLLDSHRVRAKRSMKFASNSYAAGSMDDDFSERDACSQTSGRKHSQHIGMFTRGHSNQGPDQDSPYSAASRLRVSTKSDSNNSSRRQSPRSGQQTPTHANGRSSRKGEIFDFGASGDDEHTPLLPGSLRTPRTRASRRPADTSRRHMEYYDDPRRGCMSRLAGGMVMFVMGVLVLLGISGFFFATTKPMSDVHIQQIKNVLASEAEIMLDLQVEAMNPNMGSIAVMNVDLNIFAKSRHVGDPDPSHNHTKDGVTSSWRRHRPRRPNLGIRDDDPSDPLPGDGDGADGDGQTMLLGRIFYLDSALLFEGSPLRHEPHNATGELRVSKPGRIEENGRERWERVLPHEFELIVRGVLKYQLPLNSRVLTASVVAGVLVHPEAGVDEHGAMFVEPLKNRFIWEPVADDADEAGERGDYDSHEK